MCKEKHVTTVKAMLPGGGVTQRAARGQDANISRTAREPWTHKELDTKTECIIIVFTAFHGRSATDQTIVSPRQRDTQPAAKRREKRDVPGQRFLRSRRSAAGQIRDAPPRRGRQAVGQRGSEGVRILATVLLSGTGSISGRRCRRPVTAQARPTIRAQADGRSDELRGGTPQRRSEHFQSATGQSNRRTLWHLSSPAQHRPAVAASKKTSVNGAPAAVSGDDRRLVAAYEELRSQAVEQWQRGPGLALMRNRGFRCWMEACRQLLDAPCRSGILKDQPATAVPAGLRGEMVLLLASMLLHRMFRGVA
jgi:hypothetical protein